MSTIKLTLPYPPTTGNHQYAQVTKYGKTGKPYQGRALKQSILDWRDDVGWEARRINCEPLQGDLHMTTTIYRPEEQGDISNVLKVVEDALKGYAFDDDEQIMSLCALRYTDPLNPRIEVEITPMWQE